MIKISDILTELILNFSYEILRAGKKISLDDLLTATPPYLRFDVLELDYSIKHVVCGRFLVGTEMSGKSSGEKCEWSKTVLPLLKNAFNGCKFKFHGAIDKNCTSYFGNYQSLLEHVRGELLPIFNAYRSYEFVLSVGTSVNYLSDWPTDEMVVEILQDETIHSCSIVIFDLDWPMRVHIGDIATRFNRTVFCGTTPKQTNGQKSKGRFLKIIIGDYGM